MNITIGNLKKSTHHNSVNKLKIKIILKLQLLVLLCYHFCQVKLNKSTPTNFQPSMKASGSKHRDCSKLHNMSRVEASCLIKDWSADSQLIPKRWWVTQKRVYFMSVRIQMVKKHNYQKKTKQLNNKHKIHNWSHFILINDLSLLLHY